MTIHIIIAISVIAVWAISNWYELVVNPHKAKLTKKLSSGRDPEDEVN